MYKELIDSFIAKNKDDHAALQSIEAFLHECNRYVGRETIRGHRERFLGVDIPFTDTKDLEKAYEAVKKYGFSLPEDNKAQKEAQGQRRKRRSLDR